MVCPQTAYGPSAECLIDGGFIPQTGAKLRIHSGAGVFNELALLSAPALNFHLRTYKKEGVVCPRTQITQIMPNNQQTSVEYSESGMAEKSAEAFY